MSDKKTEYPVTKETMHSFAESLFAPIRRGENVTTVWVPMAGRRMWSKFIIENIDLFAKELPNFEKYVLVYVEPLDLTEESLVGYLRLIAQSFVDACKEHKEIHVEVEKKDLAFLHDEEASYSKMLSELQDLFMIVSKADHEVVLFLGEFDELNFANKIFYHNLKSLWSRLYPTLHYVFLMRERITREENILAWGELNEVILQNILRVPVRSDADMDYIIDYLTKQYKTEVKEEEREMLKKLCGGHPYLLKVCMRVLDAHKLENEKAENIEQLMQDYYEAKSVAKGILAVRSKRERDILKNVVDEKPITKKSDINILNFMIDLGMVRNVKDKFEINGVLLRDAISSIEDAQSPVEIQNGSLDYEEANGAITFNGKTVEELFTRQEYSLLSMFLRNPDKLLSRDDIGEALWGEESYEKYSDWAIDQVMSKIRKKLKDIGSNSEIHTVRGRGYKFTA